MCLTVIDISCINDKIIKHNVVELVCCNSCVSCSIVSCLRWSGQTWGSPSPWIQTSTTSTAPQLEEATSRSCSPLDSSAAPPLSPLSLMQVPLHILSIFLLNVDLFLADYTTVIVGMMNSRQAAVCAGLPRLPDSEARRGASRWPGADVPHARL